MTIRPSLSGTVILLLLLGVGSYVTAEEDPLLALLALPLLALGLWLTRPATALGPQAAVLPKWSIPALIIAASLYAGLTAARSGVDVTLIAWFAIALLLIKLGDRRTARDESQLIALGAFLAVAAVLTNPGFLVGVQVIVFFPTLMAAVMIYQLYRAQTEAEGESIGLAQAEPATETRVAGLSRPFRRLVVTATLSSMIAALGVFLIMPRGIGEGVLGAWGGPRTGSVTGFAETVQLGRAGVISESPEVAFDLAVTDRFNASLGSVDRTFYLRGAVLDQYDAGRWIQTNQRWDDWTLTQRSPQHNFGVQRDLERDGAIDNRAAINQTITLRAATTQPTVLFGIWRPVSVHYGRPGKLRHDVGSGAIKGHPESSGVFTYTITSWPVDPPVEDGPIDRPERLEFPLERVRFEAERILRAAGIEPDPAARAWADDELAMAALSAAFEQGFTYSLEQQPPPIGADPIEEFLFTTKTGHCEYFASALAAMAQSVGIRARVITGYVANEYEDSRASYVVRQDDAHAWVEAQLGPGRWRTYDPTPAADLRRIQQVSRDLIGSVRHWLDQIEFAWNRSIVSFDERSRTRLFTEGLGSWGRGVLDWTRRSQAEERARARRFLPALLTGLTVFCIVAALGLTVSEVARWIKKRRRRVDGVPSDPVSRAAAGLYERWLDELDRRGLGKPDWCPPLAHGQSLLAKDRSLAVVGEEITRLFYRARFGARGPTTEDLASAEAAFEAARSLRAIARSP
jgi:protein-glutamine gamma-glutamyltransferase